MRLLLQITAWGLVICAPVSIFLALKAGQPLKDAILPFGVFVAIAGLLFNQCHDLKEARQKDSLFYLESCVKAYDGAQALLKDGNNDRVTWIAAGRALVHAKNLADHVTVKAHRNVLELTRLEYRRFFDSVIRVKHAAFFYGINDPTAFLADAARRSSEGEGNTLSLERKLSEESIHAVWEAAQWPKGYEKSDPLASTFADDELGSLYVLYPELYSYLQHRRTNSTFAGKVFTK